MPRKLLALQQGDHLSRDEFHRRYEAMPDIKAELFEGVVHMPSPLRFRKHGQEHSRTVMWGGYYIEANPGVDQGDNCTLKLDDRNEPPPDLCVFILPESGGQIAIDEYGYLLGAPDLVVEVAATSVSIDLHQKLTAYRRNGVREYVVWRTEDREIDWFQLGKSELNRLSANEQGIFKSQVLPGLWLDHIALLRDELPRVHKVADEGIASPEHATFVATLQQRASEKKT